VAEVVEVGQKRTAVAKGEALRFRDLET